MVKEVLLFHQLCGHASKFTQGQFTPLKGCYYTLKKGVHKPMKNQSLAYPVEHIHNPQETTF